MMTDPISDMLTRMRNAILVKHPHVDIPKSNIKVRIAEILKDEGYIDGFELLPDQQHDILRINLRYIGEDMESPIHGLQRESRPGRRRYTRSDQIPAVLGGMGIAIVSTSKGLMSGKNAAKAKVGGEVVCSVW